MNPLDVILIDDDITNKVYLQKSISKTPSHKGVYTFSNGKEALSHLDRAEHLDQVLIFLDINMPVLNGWGFLDELQSRSYRNQVNVLIMSSSATSSEKKKSKKYPQVNGYLEKPFPSETIIDIIDLFNNNIIIPKMEARAV